MALVYLLLGTNLGDRAANLKLAHEKLEAVLGRVQGASETVETEAVGFDGPAFLNRVEAYRTLRAPRTILSLCKQIEKSMGRTGTPEYRPDGSRIYKSRIIDIDILEYRILRRPEKSLEISTPALTVPHPQIVSRPFVRPLLDMAVSQTIKQK